jgi:hypothetical protein
MTDFDWAILAEDSHGSQSLICPTIRPTTRLSRGR